MKIVAERINGDVSLWAAVKKQNNSMFLSDNKQQTVKIHDQSVDLKETKDLYGRLMVLAKSNRDIDKKSAAGNFEFTLTPRALFAPDGSILPCAGKSKLIHCLEKLDKNNETDQNAQLPSSEDHVEAIDEPETSIAASPKIVIVDGMVLVQQTTKKSGTISIVKDLSQHFNDRLLTLTEDFDEVILVFDTYKAESLKQKTRQKRRQGKDPIQYQIANDTSIKQIPMGRFLSHEKNESRSSQISC